MGGLPVGHADEGRQRGNIPFGNTLSEPAYAGQEVQLHAGKPAFRCGLEEDQGRIEAESELGYARPLRRRSAAYLGRFLPVPAAHAQKMEPVEGKGPRLAIVLTARRCSPGLRALGSRGSGSGSWRTTWLEGIVGLPDQLFYNTGISTYFWILSNRKAAALKDKVILLDARDQWKRCASRSATSASRLAGSDRARHQGLRRRARGRRDEEHPDHAKVKVFRTRDFGYHRITVERPLTALRITEDTLTALRASARWRTGSRDALVPASRPLRAQGVVDEEGGWRRPARRRRPARAPSPTRFAGSRAFGARSRCLIPRARCRQQGRGAARPRPARL